MQNAWEKIRAMAIRMPRSTLVVKAIGGSNGLSLGMRRLRQATRRLGFTILSRRSKPSDMRKQANRAESDDAEGFTLARVRWFPYNPVDFHILGGRPAGIAVASLNG
jgi:hypothetical protein